MQYSVKYYTKYYMKYYMKFNTALLAATFCLLGMLSGCGQSGKLYLPNTLPPPPPAIKPAETFPLAPAQNMPGLAASDGGEQQGNS
jgi:predicted small lipoprotein YifL